METKKRLIDADALLKDGIRVECGYDADGILMIPLRDVTNSIKNAPTVDAVEVVHGRWVNIVDYGDGNCYGFCSACAAEQKAQSGAALKAFHRYCRWCGAKMDGERGGADHG